MIDFCISIVPLHSSYSAMAIDKRIYELSRTATFMTGDGDLWVTNRFGRLHLINVLAIQQRLVDLEDEVNGYVASEIFMTGHNIDAPDRQDLRNPDLVLGELKKVIQEYSIKIPPYCF